MIGIVVSRADSASEHVGEHLLDVGEWTEREDATRPDADGGGAYYRTDGFELRTFDALHLDLSGVADAFSEEPEFVAFASRHAGETGPLLTAHFTGNFGPAEYGGEADALSRACPAAQKRVVVALAERAPEGYDVGTECTHHGPSAVGAPSMFVELGSGEEQWADLEAARAVAEAILDLRGTPADDPAGRHLAWFGGGHYAPRSTRVVRETDWTVGHVAADWCLDAMGDPEANRDVVSAALAESAAEFAVVQDDRPGLERALADLGVRVVGETWVRETDGVPLDLVARLEDAVTPVSEGLRFGAAAAGYDGGTEVVDLPADLVEAANGVDREATLAAADRCALAYETVEGGNRLRGAAAFAGPDDWEAFVADLLDVLREKYDEVSRDGDAAVATETAFDPRRAAALGVPEGPAFGRLAAGEPVTVGDKTVLPEDVSERREVRFSVTPDAREESPD